MDGIDNPPFMRKRSATNRVNTFLDACYIIPRRIGKVRAAPAGRRSRATSRSTSSAPATCRSRSLDPALTRPGRMGRHIWFRTPTKDDRWTSSTSTSTRSRTSPTSTPSKRRDEIARITNGYSPAMIEQVCSMALTYAHHDGRERFGWERHRRGDDHGRVGHRGRASSTSPRRRGPSRSTRRATPSAAPRLHEGRRVDAPLDPHARRLARPPPGAREGGALQLLAPRGGRAADLDAGRDGRGARLLRRELTRRRRRRAERDRPRGAGWSAAARWRPSAIEFNGRFATREPRRTRRARRS